MQLLVLKFLCSVGRYADLLRTEHFIGFLFGGNMSKKNLKKVLEHLPHYGICELMCHPGLDDQDTSYSHWGYSCSEELNALIDPEISEFIHHKRIHLISYRQLPTLLGGDKF